MYCYTLGHERVLHPVMSQLQHCVTCPDVPRVGNQLGIALMGL